MPAVVRMKHVSVAKLRFGLDRKCRRSSFGLVTSRACSTKPLHTNQRRAAAVTPSESSAPISTAKSHGSRPASLAHFPASSNCAARYARPASGGTAPDPSLVLVEYHPYDRPKASFPGKFKGDPGKGHGYCGHFLERCQAFDKKSARIPDARALEDYGKRASVGSKN